MLTEDIKPKWTNWLNVIRRLQETGCKQNGLAVVKITIVLNSDGEPVFWLNPDVKLIEPKNKITEKDLYILAKVFGEEFVGLL
jgi:hypothetical protein